jgi:histidinol dehydrogenase
VITADLDLEIEALEDLSAARRAALLDRGRARLRDLREPVARILADVRARGDAAVLEYAVRYDVAPASLRVPVEEIAAALAAADPAYLAALGQASANIEAFHRAQLGALLAEEPVETAPGVRLWRVWRPIERVGVYVPGGGAIYPSCLLMSAIPARVAGCAQVAVCTPPGPDAHVPPAVLAAAALAGVQEVYAVGGAQAIGALAYGTATIPAVDKLFGPGSSFVATAKALVAGEVATDLPAGPSEVLVLADDTSDPAWVAADLLAQAEHGPESACVLVTNSAALAERVRAELRRQLPALASAPVIRESLRRNGALLVARTLAAAIAFANEYATEHLEVLTAEPEALLGEIAHAGSVFLGGWSPVPAGDYASGGNHTLPTARYARGFGPLAIEAFGRRMQVQRLSREGLGGIRASIETLATAEGLPGHAAAARIRFDQNVVPEQEAQA